MQKQQPTNIKLVIVGDGTIGKTCILTSFAHNTFPTQYVPTVFDNQTTTLKVDGEIVNLSLWDTAGQEEYSRLRPLAYPGADIFLITFAVTEPSTFVNAKKKWYPEVEEANHAAIKLFVGNKIDIRDNPNATQPTDPRHAPILKETARKVFEDEFKCKYVECSALTRQGLKEAFDQAIRLVLRKRGTGRKTVERQMKDEKGCCSIM